MVGCFLFSWWYHFQLKVFNCDIVQFICSFFLLLFVFSIFWSFSQSLLNLLQAFALTTPPKLLFVRSPVSSMLLIQPPRLSLHSLWQSSYLLLLEISTFYPLDFQVTTPSWFSPTTLIDCCCLGFRPWFLYFYSIGDFIQPDGFKYHLYADSSLTGQGLSVPNSLPKTFFPQGAQFSAL